MSRTRFALTSLLAAVLALTPIIQPMAIYADVQQEAVETLGEDALPDPAPDAAPAPQDDAADAGQIAPSAEDAPAPDGAASEEVPEESADDLSDTPSSDQSMAYSWRYEAGELIASEEGPRDGTAFRSARVTLPSGATAWGIDVSYANGAINWTQVKRAGVDFAILRLGYGWGGDDAQFLNNVAGARANGIKIGVYLYSYAWDAASATREAQWTLQVLQRAGLNPSDLDLPVFYDIENVSKKTGKPAGVDDNNQYREITGGPAGFAAMATAWANVIKGAGFTPGMYTSKTWWETYLTDAVFGQWQRWVAQWNSTNTYKGTYSTWQYTSDGTVAGISGRVDLNYSYDPRFAKPDTSNVKTSLTRSGDAVTAIISGFGENPTNVSFALTTPAGAVTWHQAYKQPDGSWKTNLSLASVFDRAGSYRVMAYGTFGFYTYDLTGASLQVSQPSSSVSLLLEDGGLTAAASAWTMSPSNVAFMVTAPGGKTAWYQGVKGSNGTWAASIPAGTDFGSYGTYTAAAYATVGGKTDAYGTAKAVVTVPTVANNLKASDGRLVSSSAGWTLSPSNVAFRVDSPTGATRWYQGYRQSDGSWTASFNATADFGDWDTYSATTYATFAGSTKSYGSAVASLSPGVIRVDASASGTDVALAASGWAVAPSNVAFRVELPSGDVTWVQAYRQADGAWTARFSALKGYGQLGTYRATAYATFGGRTSTFGDEATVKVTLGDIQVSATARNADIALKASGWDQAPTNVAFAVKAPSGAVTWLQAYRQTDGSWSATASAASAFKAWGTYRATAYATFSGSTIQVGADSVQVDAGSIKVSASVSSAGDITATASGWKISPSNVAFEVRMASGTVKWFQAARQADGSWKMGISAARDLREWGSYRVTAYATIAGWTSSYGSASTSFDVGDVRTSAVVSGGGSFDLWLAGFKVTPSNAAFEVLLPQGGSKWIQAVRQGNGSWKATGYASQGFSVYGTYRVRAYVTIQGLTLPLASTSFTFPPYVGYQNPSWMYQVSNQSARIKNQGLNQFGYASPSRIPYNATRNDLVNAVITRAMDYMGTPYRWDYSTAPGGGVDCSGLVMQALYAVGMDLTPYNPWDHYYTPGHDQYANHMWSNPRFKHVSFGERQPGDLICYAGHISIYLGNDRVIEAYPPRVMISSIYARPQMRGVIRAIA